MPSKDGYDTRLLASLAALRGWTKRASALVHQEQTSFELQRNEPAMRTASSSDTVVSSR